MNNLFGTKKKVTQVKAPSFSDISNHVILIYIQLGERSKAIEEKLSQCNKDLIEAKALMKKQTGTAYQNTRRKAFNLIKRRKVYEAQLKNMGVQINNLEQLEFTNEAIQSTLDTVIIIKKCQATTMKQAITAQKAMMKDLDLDQLEDLQDDMQDLMDDQNEVQEILSRDYAIDDYDEAEIEGELEELDGEIVNEKLEGNAVPSYLPAQPKPPVAINNQNHLMNIN